MSKLLFNIIGDFVAMSKIIKNLNVFSGKTSRKIGFLRKFAATSILSAIIISLCGSNLAFAEIGGGREF